MYVYYTDPHLFYECLITVVIEFLHTSTIPPRPPKKKKEKKSVLPVTIRDASLHLLSSKLGLQICCLLPAILHQKQPPEVFYAKRCSKEFYQIHRKTLCQSLFYIKVEGLACNLIKKKTLAQVFSCEFFQKFLITPFLQNTSGQLLLDIDVNDILQSDSHRPKQLVLVASLKALFK